MVTLLTPNDRALAGLSKGAQLVQAQVDSTDGKTTYNVSILTQPGSPAEAYCSCPDAWMKFGDKQYQCKHVVQTLEATISRLVLAP
jgi:hypothetical protein